MKHCVRCVLPDTRPNLLFDAEGVCSACRNHATKKDVDWESRAAEFRALAARLRSLGREYDCIVPVSGGKDSTWQTIVCLEHGLKPLALTWKSPSRTDLGRENLENLVRLGVDHVDFSVNPAVEKEFCRRSLAKYGTPMIPMHLAIFMLPLRFARRFGVPIVFYGENSAFEYGHDEDATRGFALTKEWFRKYGVTHGTTAADWVSDGLSAADLSPYTPPSDDELARHGIRSAFLGYYFPWDPRATFAAAAARGFKASAEGPKTGLYDFADVDDHFISIHHFLKWYKFGFTRLADNLSLEIRSARMTRAQAVEILARAGDPTPRTDIARFCGYLGVTEDAFYALIESFRNPALWKRVGERWVMPDYLAPEVFA